MSRLKVMLGGLFAAGLCICAIGVSSASALTNEECLPPVVGSTSVSCGGANKWIGITGKYKTTPKGTSVLASTVGGVEFEIQCKKLSGEGTSENVEPSAGVMHNKETGIVVKYEECAVSKPAACTVPATITTNSLKSTTVSGTMSQKYEPTVGTTFVSFEVGGAACPAALKGVKTVTGSATSTMSEAQEAAGEEEFNVTKASGELKYAGQNAEFRGKNTRCTADGTPVFRRTP